MFKNKLVVRVALLFWFILAILYCTHVPYDHLTNDFWGHLQYSEIIATKHRLPYLGEGMETFQPPLYYLINCLIAPCLLQGDKIAHIDSVRALSILYGALSILIILWFLQQVTQNTLIQLLSILFIITTPTFIFVFSSYNNDSLAILLSLIIIVTSYKLDQSWSWKLAGILLLVSTAALYTKLTAVFPIVTVFIFCCTNLLQRKPPTISQIRIIGILCISTILLFPWFILHNYKDTKNFFLFCPTFAPEQPNKRFDLVHFKNLAGIVFRIPALQLHKPDYTHEWDDPWLHTRWDLEHPATKRYDYLSSIFVTSIVGEGIFHTPNVQFIWIVFLTHLIAYLSGIQAIFKSRITKLSSFVICFVHFLQITTILFFPNLPHRAMGYRYICWTWLPWSILYSSALSNKSDWSFILKAIFILGTITQIYIGVTVAGGFE